MKKLLIALLFAPTMAHAEFMSGNNLYKDMQGDALDNIHALGYVLGAADSAINVTVCPPEGVKAGQVYDIIKKFLEANPQGMSKNSVRAGVTGGNDMIDLALDLLAKNYVRSEREGQRVLHFSVKPFREGMAA